MNLEAIALRRAEEQISKPCTEILRNPTWKASKKKRVGKGRPITCLCGTCAKCKKREWQRKSRAKNEHSPKICGVEGCLRHVHTAGKCWRHHRQVERWGRAFPNRRRVASAEFVARVREKLAAKGINVEAA